MSSQLNVATWVIDVLGVFFDMLSKVFVQPGTSRRPVDWCMNLLSVLYDCQPITCNNALKIGASPLLYERPQNKSI